jgi:hypothetical protein
VLPVVHQANIDDELDLIATHLYESKNGKEVWLKTPYVSTGRQPSRNVMKQVPGPTAYARRNSDTMISTLELHITKHISRTILKMSNEEGARVFGDEWTPIGEDEFYRYMGLLYLAGVYRSNGNLLKNYGILWINAKYSEPLCLSSVSRPYLKFFISTTKKLEKRDLDETEEKDWRQYVTYLNHG